ncbi:MAG TPA: glycosyltransferase [Mycobacteriales bacterium]|nr:glycosyltransferase [Mycobacteriales bacterium]
MLVPLARVVLPADPALLPLHVVGDAEVLDARRLRVPPGGGAQLAGLLSAFPAGHWRHGTGLNEVVLRLVLTGDGTAVVRRSDSSGRAGDVVRLPPGSHEVPVALLHDDGGWLWVEVEAGPGGAVLGDVAWCAPELSRTGGTTVVMTAFAHQGAALQVLRDLADPPTLALLDEVVVVDQGERPLQDEPAWAEAVAGLDTRLRVVRQPNLGAGGGVARGQLEALRAGRSRWVLVLDDDVVLGPETVPRAVAFAERARRPVQVGGHMLDLERPTVLHTPGERIDPRRWLWETVPPGEEDLDLAASPLPAVPWLHRRLDVDYNPWWCVLVPVEALRRAGLPLPVFIKWDDVEHGLRLGPTVTLPGVAVHHEPFTGKPDALGWQAYVHHRNRLVAGLLHSPRPWGGALLPESARFTWRPLRRGRRDLVALRTAAMADLLRGPAHLVDDLPHVPARALAVQEQPGALPRLAAEAVLRHVQVALRWRSLRRRYRAALPDLVSPGAWERTLARHAE